MFTGEYRHSVDGKGRLAVPARFRAQLQSGAVVSRWMEPCLAIHTKAGWDLLSEKIAALPITDPNARLFQRYVFSQATEAELDGQGRVLLARRSSGARDEPGTWDSGAGALEFGESFADAVTREVGEEYRAAPLSMRMIGVRNVVRPGSHWVALVFAVRVDPGAVSNGEPHKFDALGWFRPESLPSPVHSQLGATIELLGATFPGGDPS